NEGGGTLHADEIADALVRLLEAFAEGTGGAAPPLVDLNLHLEPEGRVRGARGRRRASVRRPQLQSRPRGLRAGREGSRAVRPALARGRPLRSGRSGARPARRPDADLLGRETLRPPR